MTAFFEDVAVGFALDLGSHTFTREEIIAFARAYDPQSFHLDEEAARRSPFGGLCASGWHTAAVWMKLMVARTQGHASTQLTAGERRARPGPSPGFKNMRWLKPVFVGDTIAYATEVTGKRDLNSRPNWGLVLTENTGVNQHGSLVFAFNGQVLFERRTPFASA